MKKILAFVLALCLMLSLSAVSMAEPVARVAGMKGPTAMGMVNGTLLMLRYSEHWYAWVITTILYLAMDISAGAYGLLIDDVAMLVVTFYGIWKWWKYTREHNTIQEKIDFRV